MSEQQSNEANRPLSKALFSKPALAAESLGHIDYQYYTDSFTAWLAPQDYKEDTAEDRGILYQILASRKVNDRR